MRGGGGAGILKYRFRSNDPQPAGREDRNDGNNILHRCSCTHIRNPLSAQWGHHHSRGGIVLKVPLYIKLATIIVVAACLLGLGGYINDLNGGSLDFSDIEMRVVVSGSMDGEPREEYDIQTILVGSMVFIQKVPEGPYAYDFYSSLQIGDVVTFDHRNPVTRENMVVTHRIIDISDSGGDIRFTMAGDAIRDDPTNSSEQVIRYSRIAI